MKKLFVIITMAIVFVCCLTFAACSHTHNFVDVQTVPPTCTEEGYTMHVCDCGYCFKDSFVNKLNHKLSEYSYNQDATCEHDGTKTAHCERTGCTYTDTVAASDTKINHDLCLTEIMIDKSEHDIDRCGKFVCQDCGETIYKTISYEDINIPIIDLSGDISTATKEITANVNFSFEGETNFSDIAGTVKWQGASSVNYPEKNYTLKLSSKIKVVDEWGKQKKYCLKANYVDFTQAKNIVSSKIYGQIVKSRNIEDEVSGLVNGGAIDGFAVLVYNNGEFLGVYTLNIPKDKWLFGMEEGDEKNQAILQAQDGTGSTMLCEPIADDFSNGWDLEFYSNEDSKIDNSSEWVVTKFNEFMNFLLENESGESFKAGIGNYVNVERCIDVFLYTAVIQGMDNQLNNILYITYDGGNTWQPSVYDLDSTWGGYAWGNKILYAAPTVLDLSSAFGNVLFVRLFNYYYDEIKARYKELRAGILSNENIIQSFESFYSTIPDVCYKADAIKWPNKPNIDTNNITAIKIFLNNHLSQMDSVLN